MRDIRRHARHDLGWDTRHYDVMGYWSGSRGRQARTVDPGPIYARGKAQGKSDDEIWAEYDEARSDPMSEQPAHRSGFACFVGRPNAGKSTLTNAIVGTKVAITSSKPQTTRTVVRGIVHRPDAQLILVDTPGLHRPRTLLGERLNDLVDDHLVRGRRRRGLLPGQREARSGRPVPGQRAGQGAAYDEVRDRHQDRPGQLRGPRQAPARHRRARPRDRHRVGRDRAGLGRRTATRCSCSPTCWSPGCPRGRSSTPTASSPTPPRRSLVAELIREAALEGVRDELPHSIAVVVEEMGAGPGPAGRRSRCW